MGIFDRSGSSDHECGLPVGVARLDDVHVGAERGRILPGSDEPVVRAEHFVELTGDPDP